MDRSAPAGIHIQKGKVLAHGYGQRLDARALKGLPCYQGYKWRRAGSDIVLLAVTTGIVSTIVQGDVVGASLAALDDGATINLAVTISRPG